MALSTALSVDPHLSLTGTNWRRFGSVTQASILLFAVIAAAHFATRPAGVRVLLRGAALAGLAAALYLVLQYFGMDPLLPSQAYRVGEGVWSIVRPPSTLGHASYFADWGVFVVFWCAALAATDTSRAWRILAGAAAVLLCVAVVLSGTRAGIVGLLAGVVVLTAAAKAVQMRRAAVSVAVLLALGLLFYLSPLGLQLRSRTRWYVEDPHGGARLMLWRDTASMARAHWFSGYGPETFSAAFPAFESAELARAFPDFYHESPHNIFLDALAAQGALGLLALAAFVWVGFSAARLDRGPLAVALAAALAAGVASQQFTSFTAAPALYFYLTVAILVASVPHPGPAEPRRQRALLLAVAPAALVLTAFAAELLAADWFLEQARRAVGTGGIARAAACFDRYRAWQPRGAGSDLWYSRAMVNAAASVPDPLIQLQAWREAGVAALRAAGSAEDPQNAWYNLAEFYARQNDPERTETSLKSAIAASPNWFKPHWVLAQVLRLSGRAGEAEQEARIAVNLNGGKNPEVQRTLDELRSVRVGTPRQ
jgi:O-antigen ligase